jgi:hypothetical protein
MARPLDAGANLLARGRQGLAGVIARQGRPAASAALLIKGRGRFSMT